MRVLDSLVRWGKLGLFLGWGVGAAIWSACSSTPAPQPDTSGDLRRREEARPADAAVDRARDAGVADRARDARAADQKPAIDKRAWDIPLE